MKLFVPETVSAFPAPINVVWLPLVFPYWSEPTEPPKAASTRLLMFEMATTFATGSKYLMSSKVSGTWALNQLPELDQLFAPAPGPFHIIVDGGLVSAIVERISLGRLLVSGYSLEA